MRKKHANPEGEPALPPGSTSAARPSQEEIARRAHEIYLARGGGEGHEIEDWLQAERELTQKE